MEHCSTNKPLNYKILFFTFYISLILVFEKLSILYFKEYDLELIKFTQSYNSLDTFWKIVSFFGSKEFKLYLFPIVFCIFNIYFSFLYISIMSVSLLLTSQVKLLIQEDRPFWTYPDIPVYSCELGYGFPSDHTMVSTPIYLFLYNIIWDKFQFSGRTAKIFNGIGKILIFIFLVLIGVSRVYMGAHYYFQIVSGILLGIGIYLFFFSLLEFSHVDYEPFLRLIDNIYFRTTILFVYLLFYLLYLFSLLFTNEPPMQEWIMTIVLKCNKFPWFTPLIQGLINSSYYFMSAAAIGGNILIYNIYYGTEKKDKFIKDLISNENRIFEGSLCDYFKFSLYIIGNLLLFFLFRNMFWIIGISFENNNLWGTYFIEKLIPNFLAVFVISAFSKFIFEFLRLIKYEDDNAA